MDGDFGEGTESDGGWNVSLDPRLRELSSDELVAIIERQANAIRILKHKAQERAALLDALERERRSRGE